MVIFDTSVLVDALKQKKAARALIESYGDKERIATTTINKYEVLRGVTEKETNLASEWLNQFVICDFEETALGEAVKVHKKLAEKGKMASELDVLIAGIALANDEMLVTRDKDFLNLESPRIRVL